MIRVDLDRDNFGWRPTDGMVDKLGPVIEDRLRFLMLVREGMKSEVLALVDRSTHGTCKLESPKIFGLRIPLPPLAEQARIVARVTELRQLCSNLRQRLTAGTAVQEQLAEALVGETVNA